jgi:hypothetical protein
MRWRWRDGDACEKLHLPRPDQEHRPNLSPLRRRHPSIAMIDEKCAALRALLKIDKRRGKITSDADKDFIRRTCPCEHCLDWRRRRSTLN